ncbi:MAG: YfhO family protein, partial [Bacteroidota bacterium]
MSLLSMRTQHSTEEEDNALDSIPHYLKAVGIMVLAVVLAIGLNATNIMATQEYAANSTRGKSELTIKPDGSPKDNSGGLNYDYITEYSYGKLETFNLLIPNFMGGGSSDGFPEDSEAAQELLKLGASPQEAMQFLNDQIPFYWGDQPIVAAPAYIGAVVIFLAVLALFLVRGRLKWWVLAGFTLSLLLSWGKNFSWLTELFIDYVPLYDKFRAVSSIQVIIELVLPILAVVGLRQFFNDVHPGEKKKKALMYATGIVGGIGLLFVLLKSQLFSFAGPYDSIIIDQMGIPFIDAVREDRMAVMSSDALRSIFFVLATAAALWLVYTKKIKEVYGIGIIVVLVLIDLVGVNTRYVNSDNFVVSRIMEKPFLATAATERILEDKGYYRVYDARRIGGSFKSGEASYFHNALGGYHAAKLGRINDIYEFYLIEGEPEIFDMFNVKYILVPGEEGQVGVQENPYANGPAWFVESVLPAPDANAEIMLLDSLDTKETAVIHTDYLDKIPSRNIQRDSLASIDLTEHLPNYLKYETSTQTDQLAIFSEVYYPEGWNAYIDGEPSEHFRANYALRAMMVPRGVHQIEFKFEPAVVRKGSTITLAFNIVFLLVLGGAAFIHFRKKKPTSEQ